MQEEVDKRERAAAILDNWELLALYSHKYREVGRHDSDVISSLTPEAVWLEKTLLKG